VRREHTQVKRMDFGADDLVNFEILFQNLRVFVLFYRLAGFRFWNLLLFE